MDVLIIVNGAHRLQAETASAIAMIEQDQSLNCMKFTTSKAKEAISAVKNLGKDNGCILAVGGDGTCFEVINGIMQANLTNVRFGIIPNGTGNDFMRIAVKFNAQNFLKRMKEGNSSSIDLGRIKDGQKNIHFLNIADIGFGGKVIDTMDKQRTSGLKGRISYASAILRTFFSFKRPVLQVKGDDFIYEGQVMMVAICNGSVFGNGLVVHPEARVDDGQFGVTLFGKVTIMDYVRNLRKLKKGIRIDHPEVYYISSRTIQVNSVTGSFYAEADGESLDLSSPYFSVLPEAIQFINELR